MKSKGTLSAFGQKLRFDRATRLAALALMVVFSLLASSIQGPALAQEEIGPQAPDASWVIQRVDAPKLFVNMSDRSLAMDAIDRPRVAYGGDHLYFAYFDPEAKVWHPEVVDASYGVGQYAALAYDKFNNPRISYYDANNGALKFAYQTGPGLWNIQVVDGPGSSLNCPVPPPGKPLPEDDANNENAASNIDWLGTLSLPQVEARNGPFAAAGPNGVGMYSSMAVDANNRVHVSYYDANLETLKYATWNGIQWSCLTLDTAVDGSKFTSIAVDGSNYPHISYFNEKYDQLRYAFYDGKNWWVEEVTPRVSKTGPYTSIAVETDGTPHISFYDFQDGVLMYATRTGDDAESWEYTVVNDDSDVGRYTSIALTPDGVPCMSYYDVTNQDLLYSCGAGSSTVITSTGSVGLYSSLAFEVYTSGNTTNWRPHVSYFNETNGKFMHAIQVDGKWKFYDIDQSFDVGMSSSLEFNASGTPYISYFNQSGNDLMLATREGASWGTQVVTDTLSNGFFSSLDIDSSGKPHVAYYEANRGDLWYAQWDGAKWVQRKLSSYYDIGEYVSMELDSQNLPHMSFYDATNGDLIYGHIELGSNAWITKTVDWEGDVGLYTSISLNSAGRPRISYYDYGKGRLKYASYSPIGVWEKQVVEEIEGVDLGLDTGLAIDALNHPHISYYDNTNGNLKYAASNCTEFPCAFSTQVVDGQDNVPSADVGMYTSIQVDNLLRPHISYYDYTHGDLKYAGMLVGNQWTIETIDPNGDVGMFTSMDLNLKNQPCVSYYDATNGDLKYACRIQDMPFSVFLPIGIND